MRILKNMHLLGAVFLLASAAWAQSAPLKVTVKRVAGAGATYYTRGSSTREAKLHVTVQNMSNKTLEDVTVEWLYVIGDRYVYSGNDSGIKTLELKPLEKEEFDTDFVEVSRYGQSMRGHWLRVTVDGKMVFEECNPESVRKYIERELEQRATRRKQAEEGAFIAPARQKGEPAE